MLSSTWSKLPKFTVGQKAILYFHYIHHHVRVWVCLFPITSHNPQSQLPLGTQCVSFHISCKLPMFPTCLIIYPSSHKHGFGKWVPHGPSNIRFLSFRVIFHFHDGRKGIHPFPRPISNSPEQGISGKPHPMQVVNSEVPHQCETPSHSG